MPEPILKSARGYSRLTTNAIPNNLDTSEVTNLHNMIYKSDGSIEAKLGSVLFKNNTQWGENDVIGFEGYELNETGAEMVALLDNGKGYFITVANYSTDPRTVFDATATFTEITRAPSGNLLAHTDKNNVYFKVLNNEAFLTDGGNQILYYGSDHVVHTVPDPVGFEATFTVPSGSFVLDDVYEYDADTSITFNVEASTTSSTSVILRQLTGDFRPAATGDLTQVSGTGPATSSYSAISYSNTFIGLTTIAGRLVAVSKEGDIWISEANDGTDFNGSQAERLTYGKEDGLNISNAFAFARAVILNGSNQELQKSASSSITGSIRPDTNIITELNPDDFFKITRESKRIALFGRSGLEVNNGFIGLSRDGFIFVDSTEARKEFGLNRHESISTPIQDLIERINFRQANKVRAVVDDRSQRYLCTAPLDDSTAPSILFVYDFKHSTFASANRAAVHKWSIFTIDFDGAHITSMSTVFGVPFLGLSDGSVIQLEIVDSYSDYNGNYESGYSLKCEDFGIRSRFKKLESGVLNLIVDQKTDLEISVVVDEQSIILDQDGTNISVQPIYPFDLTTDIWTAASTDLWSANPLDVWERTQSLNYTYVLQNSIPKFVDLSVVVKNATGGSRWGTYGHELIAMLADEYNDPREYESIIAPKVNP